MNYDIFSDSGTPQLTNWTGVDAITTGGSVDAALSLSPSGSPSATDFLSSVGSTLGSVADFGFKIQQNVMAAQSRAQDTQFQSLMKSLGLKTATIQAESAAQVAGYQAQGEVAKARTQAGLAATGATSAISLPILALIGFGLYMASKK